MQGNIGIIYEFKFHCGLWANIGIHTLCWDQHQSHLNENLSSHCNEKTPVLATGVSIQISLGLTLRTGSPFSLPAAGIFHLISSVAADRFLFRHPSLLRLGDEPAPFTHFTKHPTPRNHLAESPEHLLLRFVRSRGYFWHVSHLLSSGAISRVVRSRIRGSYHRTERL